MHVFVKINSYIENKYVIGTVPPTTYLQDLTQLTLTFTFLCLRLECLDTGGK